MLKSLLHLMVSLNFKQSKIDCLTRQTRLGVKKSCSHNREQESVSVELGLAVVVRVVTQR